MITLNQAQTYLKEAEELNPGPWVGHSLHVAQAAELIAIKVGMNPELAYTMGLLHDIGRRNGIHKIRHSIDGFRFLQNEGHMEHARICITHCYSIKDINNFAHADDYSLEEREFVQKYISEIKYDNYDRLIQLSDFLGLPDRVCSVEDRIKDLLARTVNPTDQYLRNTYATRDLKKYFDSMNH